MGVSASTIISKFKNLVYYYYHNNQLIEYINNTNYYTNSHNISNLKYYKLYIYINPSVESEIVDLYKNDAHKKNMLIESYLEAKKIQDFCFDAGFDLYNVENIVTNNSNCNIVDHQIQSAMTVYENGCERYVGYYLYCRSSTGSKTPLRLSNSVGIIDSGYRGNIKACFDNIKIFQPEAPIGFDKFVLNCGERYVQLCPPNLEYPMKVIIVDRVSDLGKETIRGVGGFGSTGT